MPEATSKPYWVYVIQSQQVRYGKRGAILPGFFYVGMTTDPARRLRQHNGDLSGGGKWTAKHRPHLMKAIYGPYANRSEALKAEYALKHGKRGEARCKWTPVDSHWCRGLGPEDPRVVECNNWVREWLDTSGLAATLQLETLEDPPEESG